MTMDYESKSLATSLPPPHSWADMYRTYQKEWDSLHKPSLEPDMDILDLQWLGGGQIEDEDDDWYLFGCTSTGDILLWRVHKDHIMDYSENDSEIPTRDAPPSVTVNLKKILSTKPQHRTQICPASQPLHKMQIILHEKPSSSQQEVEVSSRMRKRSSTSDPQAFHNAKRPSRDALDDKGKLLVVGSNGLWIISLRDIVHPWNQKSDSSHWYHKHHNEMIDLHIHDDISYALTPQSVYICHFLLDLTEQELDLSPHLHTKKCRWSSTLQQKIHVKEVCTSILVTKSPTDGTVTLLVVGTNQSRVLILPLRRNHATGLWFLEQEDTASKIQYLTLPGRGSALLLLSKDSGSQTSITTTSSRSDNAMDTSWSVNKIVETHGTWWTVSAKANHTTTPFRDRIRNRINDNDEYRRSQHCGIMATFHAPSLALVACQETREAIHTIGHCNHSCGTHNDVIYSMGNDGAITLWKSPHQLDRIGVLSSSSPSFKTMASLSLSSSLSRHDTNHNGGDDNDEIHKKDKDNITVMAVAGIGNQVDLFVKHCRIRTLTTT